MSVIDVERFVAEGFAKVDGVAPRELGDEARGLLWERIGLSPDDRPGWTQPVVWTADLTGDGPFGTLIRGARPRFMAQTPVILSEPLSPAADSALARAAWAPEVSA